MGASVFPTSKIRWQATVYAPLRTKRLLGEVITAGVVFCVQTESDAGVSAFFAAAGKAVAMMWLGDKAQPEVLSCGCAL